MKEDVDMLLYEVDVQMQTETQYYNVIQTGLTQRYFDTQPTKDPNQCIMGFWRWVYRQESRAILMEEKIQLAISSKAFGEYCGVTQVAMLSRLKKMCSLGIMNFVEKGGQKGKRLMANTYELNLDKFSLYDLGIKLAEIPKGETNVATSTKRYHKIVRKLKENVEKS